MRSLLQPRYLLLIISLLIIIAAMVTRSTTDLHLHDTYYVISNVYIGVFFLLESFIYFLTDNYRQWRSIQYFHIIGAGLMLLTTIGWGGSAILPVLFVLTQILFIINLIAGFIRGKKVLNHDH